MTISSILKLSDWFNRFPHWLAKSNGSELHLESVLTLDSAKCFFKKGQHNLVSNSFYFVVDWSAYWCSKCKAQLIVLTGYFNDLTDRILIYY